MVQKWNSNPIKLALVGCGQIGRLHAERIVADGRCRIVAVCDSSPENARRLASQFARDAAVVADLARVIKSTAVDAAVICTPTQQHFDQTSALRAAGIHVLCEKPLADTRERIVQLMTETKSGGPLLSVAYQRRYWAAYRTLRREVWSGRHGPVRSLSAHVAEGWQPTIGGTWRDDPQQNPGGFIGDAGSHKIDMVFYVTGLLPVEVFAHSDRRGSQVEIVTTVSARLEGNVALSMSFIGDSQHFREDFQVHCAEADLLYRDGSVWMARNNQVEKIAVLEPESNPNAAFCDTLLLGAPNVASADVALPVWDFTQAILESARTQKLVRLNEGNRT